ncbi:Vesicle-associated protein 1-2 [Ananas comosus]|uniref:Vesicle-associated protein 1-2 n=1 Tax=Ananas comosus TaxID=4615 RepID=A0A199VJY3_ANACO|nr:Vesicle-associated protein 1-2 [Ananas comosus]
MSQRELLGIEPLELRFPFELKKQISCSLQLSNKTDEYVAFKSVIVNDGATAKEVTAEMFAKESGNLVNEVKLRVLYVPPPQPPSPVPEESEEGSSPRPSVSDNGNWSAAELSSVPRGHAENEEKDPESKALISRLIEEKNSAIQQNNKLRQELDILRREVSKQSGGFSLIFVVIVALLGLLLGYLVKS